MFVIYAHQVSMCYQVGPTSEFNFVNLRIVEAPLLDYASRSLHCVRQGKSCWVRMYKS